MPIHDWTKVSAGTWHAFHVSWTSYLQSALNGGLLPHDFYAQAEQVTKPFEPDVLTLQMADWFPASPLNEAGLGSVATLSPPRPRIVGTIAAEEMEAYAAKRRTLAIRHTSGDRIVALIELVSPGNKGNKLNFRAFVEKALDNLDAGHHLLIVDLFPPSNRDPDGMHNAIWGEISDGRYVSPVDARLSLIAYFAGFDTKAYVESTAVGRELIPMPLFLTGDEYYINVPLEETYSQAYRDVPRKYREILDSTLTPAARPS